MTISTGLWDAKTRLSEFVNKVVHGGQRILITRNGKPVAAIVSADDLARLESLDSEAALAARRRAMDLALADAQKVREAILAETGGRLFPPLDEVLQETRREGLE